AVLASRLHDELVGTVPRQHALQEGVQSTATIVIPSQYLPVGGQQLNERIEGAANVAWNVENQLRPRLPLESPRRLLADLAQRAREGEARRGAQRAGRRVGVAAAGWAYPAEDHVIARAALGTKRPGEHAVSAGLCQGPAQPGVEIGAAIVVHV